jgi:CheY-like chemotaxis protein
MANTPESPSGARRIADLQKGLCRGRVDLASVVHHAVEAVRSRCDSMAHELTVTLPTHPVCLDGDPARLAQIVGNLLNNACNFTPRGGRIWLTVTEELAAAGSSPGIVISVRDTVEARSPGIGQGSEFLVRLPAATAMPGPPTTTTAPPAPRRILVVDDNRDSAESLAMLLEVHGHQTFRAHDGLEAVEAATRLQPDVILLDIGLPTLNGYETARRIRERRGGKRPMLVALTGWGQEEDRRRSEEAGFDAYMVKPVDYRALEKMLAGADSD